MNVGPVKLSAASVAVLVIQLALVCSIAVKYLYQRWTCPGVWTRTAAYDPELVMRGRYLSLQLTVDGCESTLPSARQAEFPRDVNGAASETGQRDIPERHDRLRLPGNAPEAERAGLKAFVRDAVALQRLLLAVLDDWQIEHAGVLECAAHQQRRRDRVAVVGQRHAAGLFQLGNVGELLALLAA